MQRRRKLIQKTVAFIAVFVLIVMMLPTAAFAAGNGNGKGKNLPEQASKNARKVHAEKAEKVKGEDDLEDPDELDLDDVETEEDPEVMSEWAMYVHARNYWAKNTALIAPGHANLLDKLFTMGQELPGEDEALVFDGVVFSKKFAIYLEDEPFSVKKVIQAIKTARTAARVADATLETIA